MKVGSLVRYKLCPLLLPDNCLDIGIVVQIEESWYEVLWNNGIHNHSPMELDEII